MTRRPGLSSWLTLIRCEAKMVIRDTAGLVIPIGLPMLILVMSASTAGDEVVANGRTVLDVYVLPLVFTVVMATVGIVNMPSFLAYYRRSGILRRLSVTPASPAMVLVGAGGGERAPGGHRHRSGRSPWPCSSSTPTSRCVPVGRRSVSCCGSRWRRCTPSAWSSPLSRRPRTRPWRSGSSSSSPSAPSAACSVGPWPCADPLARVGELLPFGATVEVLWAAWAGAAIDPVHLMGLTATIVLGGVVSAVFFRWD